MTGEIRHFEGEFPFTRPAGSDASMFIQWKGTDLCVDFICGACGFSGHIDGMFVHAVGCSNCRTVYRMGTQVIVTKAENVSQNVTWIKADGP